MKIKKFSEKPRDIDSRIGAKPIVCYPNIKIEDKNLSILHSVRENLIKKDDCLVILGKGHEETQEKDGQILFFSDHEVVNEIYN